MLVVAGAAGAQEACPPAALRGVSENVPEILSYQVVRKLFHDDGAFTQGLVYDGRYLYESTGLRGHSSLRRLDPGTGRLLAMHALPAASFAEGLALRDNYLIQLSWQSGLATLYLPAELEAAGFFHFAGEGWGLASLPRGLLLSDGSHVLRYLDLYGAESGMRIEVNVGGQPVTGLNELELAGGLLYANVWPGSCVAVIDTGSGEVRAWIDLGPLRPPVGEDGGRDRMANGIAYDATHDSFYVTGKHWPYLYEIVLLSSARQGKVMGDALAADNSILADVQSP